MPFELFSPLLHILANHLLHLLELILVENLTELYLVIVVNLPHLPMQTHDLLTEHSHIVRIELEMRVDLFVQLLSDIPIMVAEFAHLLIARLEELSDSVLLLLRDSESLSIPGLLLFGRSLRRTAASSVRA